jgi:hypothetical protein
MVVCAVVLGGLLSGVFAVRGDVVMAIAAPVILIGYGVTATLLARRSETAALLSDQRADERRVLIQLKANALSFNVLCVVLVGGFIVQVVRGQGSGPFMWLGALAGAVYIASTAYFSRRG